MRSLNEERSMERSTLGLTAKRGLSGSKMDATTSNLDTNACVLDAKE